MTTFILFIHTATVVDTGTGTWCSTVTGTGTFHAEIVFFYCTSKYLSHFRFKRETHYSFCLYAIFQCTTLWRVCFTFIVK
jgi:hypothetical protein